MSKSCEISNVGEPLNSPFSRVYLCPQTELIMNFTMCFKHPIDVEAFKRAFSNSIMIKHPRFCSLMVRNPNGGGEHWVRTRVNIDDHFIIVHHHLEKETNNNDNNNNNKEAIINAYLADISVSTPLSEQKPLWEVHVLVGLKCVVLRVHHSIGDGVSMISMLSTCFGNNKGETKDDNNVVVKGDYGMKNHTNNDIKSNYNIYKWNNYMGIWVLIKSIYYTFVYGLRLLGRLVWVKDKVSVLSGGDGVELWPRKCASAKFNIEDFKSIKKAIPNATVNDVLLGVISHGLSRYVDFKSSQALQKSDQITAILVVNLRGNPSLEIQEMSESMRGSSKSSSSSWGNKTGILLVPINCCNGLNSLDHVKIIKATMDKKKQSYEARVSYWALNLLATYLGPKVASWCSHRVLCNTSLLISNVLGPSKEIMIADNPVISLRGNVSGQPHAITIHMVSYGGHGYLQVVVAKDIIPDPELLVKCFQDSLDDMKNSMKMI